MRFVSQIQKADDKEKFIKIIFIVESIKIRWKRFDYIFFFCNKKFAKNFHQLIIKNPRKIVLVKQSILFASLLIYFQTIEIYRFVSRIVKKSEKNYILYVAKQNVIICLHFDLYIEIYRFVSIIVMINLIEKIRKIVLRLKSNYLSPF